MRNEKLYLSALLFLGAIAAQAPARAQAESAMPNVIAETEGAGGVRLGTVATSVKLLARAPLHKGSLVRLVLRGFSAAAAPGVIYRLYLDAPDGKADPSAFVGDINFYDVGPAPRTDRFVSFDVTARLAKTGGHTLLIVPLGAPAAAAAPRIQTVELVAE
ncbi:MAG: hypothetical protein JOZ13_06645 [Alphaproteobacteria bacterium]|nr:hypothetical protein [Alphaproteobacteria bacterium]